MVPRTPTKVKVPRRTREGPGQAGKRRRKRTRIGGAVRRASLLRLRNPGAAVAPAPAVTSLPRLLQQTKKPCAITWQFSWALMPKLWSWKLPRSCRLQTLVVRNWASCYPTHTRNFQSLTKCLSMSLEVSCSVCASRSMPDAKQMQRKASPGVLEARPTPRLTCQVRQSLPSDGLQGFVRSTSCLVCYLCTWGCDLGRKRIVRFVRAFERIGSISIINKYYESIRRGRSWWWW